MSRREIRVYDHNEASTVIGFNDRAIPEDPTSIHDFFSERGYVSRDMHTKRSEGYENSSDKRVLSSLGSVSLHHVEVQPPLHDEHMPEFVEWCKRNVDPDDKYGHLIDNRRCPPLDGNYPRHDGDILATW